MKINVRPAIESDHAFIYATYLRNKWFDKNNKTTLKRSTWSSMQHKRLEKLFKEEVVLVACLSEDHDTILGYALFEGDEPYIYIKLDWRSPGIDVKGKLLKEMV